MLGDAAQSAAVALTDAQWKAYIDIRVAQGFNTVNVNLIEHLYGPRPPADRSGAMPFTTKLAGGAYTTTSEEPDFSTPNDVYWAGLERKVSYAQQKGVLVALAFYIGGGAEDCSQHADGWYGELCANSAERARSLGTYLANGRGPFGGFKKHPNVIWVLGADLRFTKDTRTRDKLRALAAAIKQAGSTQLMSGDWGVGLATDQSDLAVYMDLQSVYNYDAPAGSPPYLVESSRNAYAYDPARADGDGRPLPALPTFMKETGYEGESNPAGDATSIRRYAWTSILSGCTAGYWYGQRDVWSFAHAVPGYSRCLFPRCTNYTASLKSPGARDMARLAKFIRSIPWQKLVPSGPAAPFLPKRIVVGDDDAADGGVISAAADPAGSVAIAYTPGRTFTVDMTVMSGPCRARWWDPTKGTYTAIGPCPNTGTRAFAPPRANAGGARDWVLVLDLVTPGSSG
jgi:hypothetical protein